MNHPTKKPHIGILHYTAPPVIGGVEAVIQAQARLFTHHDYLVTIVAGVGDSDALPSGASLMLLPKLDSQHAEILRMNIQLESGEQPPDFDTMVNELAHSLQPVVTDFDHLIVHNVFTKHFNLALTAALYQLVYHGTIRHAIAWCHDFSWTSPSSRSKLYPGYPWDLLRTYHEQITYVTVSARRQETLAKLYGCSTQNIHLIYNGVEPACLLGLTQEGLQLADHLNLFESDLILLMPVRVTRAKNIEYALHVLAALKRFLRPKLILTGPPDPHDPENMDYFHSLQDLRRALGVESEARFIFESGPQPDVPYTIDERVVGDLYRLSDVLLMPSHREGFGMPVLEAGLAGIPVVSTSIPAAEEIGKNDVTIFAESQPPGDLAATILEIVESNQVSRFRRRVRQGYTWDALFHRQIEALLNSRSKYP
jgi:mannosylglucosylglycerate synthase